MKAALVDDEPLALRRLEQAIQGNPHCKVVATSRGGPDALEMIARTKPDLLFVDIQMPGQTGLELVEALDVSVLPIVIFVTAYEQYAIAAFDSGAVGYLLKPIEETRLAETIERAIEKRAGVDAKKQVEELRNAVQLLREEQSNRGTNEIDAALWINHRGKSLRIPLRDVRQFKAAGDYVSVVTQDAEYLHYDSLRSLEQSLDGKRFMRVHRSAIVALPFVESIERARYGRLKLVFDHGGEAFCSRTHRNELYNRLGMAD